MESYETLTIAHAAAAADDDNEQERRDAAYRRLLWRRKQNLDVVPANQRASLVPLLLTWFLLATIGGLLLGQHVAQVEANRRHSTVEWSPGMVVFVAL